VGESYMKESILLTGQEYSVLKEDMKLDECGWSYTVCTISTPLSFLVKGPRSGGLDESRNRPCASPLRHPRRRSRTSGKVRGSQSVVAELLE
jgi:hypothetical protein